jgi:anti-anti-sigma factor
MMTSEAAEAVVREGDGMAVIELRGRIDAAAEPAVTRAGAEAAALGRPELMLDFAGADYINSTGIALIVGLLARARAERREVSARGLTPHYREIFEITRLSDFMRIVPEEPVATPGAGGTA